jgi:hypothetical protein
MSDMSTFYICKCGNADIPHNFRHKFEKMAKIQYDEKKIILNSRDFPVETGTKCGVLGCSALPKIHTPQVITHEYKPVQFFHKNIRVVLPTEMYCVICGENILIHNSLGRLGENGINSHHFTVELYLENSSENGVHENIILEHPENDEQKILFLRK